MYLVTYHDITVIVADSTIELREKLKELLHVQRKQTEDMVIFNAVINGVNHSFGILVKDVISPEEAEDHIMKHFQKLAKATGKYKFYQEVN
jgi:hypothetical protein